jgi:hypothetical protein
MGPASRCACAGRRRWIWFAHSRVARSLRANGSRECAPDDRLREAIHWHIRTGAGLLRCARNDGCGKRTTNDGLGRGRTIRADCDRSPHERSDMRVCGRFRMSLCSPGVPSLRPQPRAGATLEWGSARSATRQGSCRATRRRLRCTARSAAPGAQPTETAHAGNSARASRHPHSPG